jgi:hypothetical protein
MIEAKQYHDGIGIQINSIRQVRRIINARKKSSGVGLQGEPENKISATNANCGMSRQLIRK